MPLAVGTRLGRYEVRSLLGAGGMGEVYLARDLKLERTAALKVLPPDASRSRQEMRRFVQEARTASALNHPNVAHIYEIEEFEGMSFIAMEFIDGETLRRRLTRKRMKLHEVLDTAVQVASALAAAHAAGIVHRDIKTENIMVSRDGYVKVLDFGLARNSGTSSGAAGAGESTISKVFTDPGTILGTVHYMSPEQARGLPVDARTDIWSFGVVLYEMIAGRPPFEGDTPSDVIASIIEGEPPPLARFSREAPESVEWLVSKALTKDRDERYQTAKELLIDLRRLKHRFEVEAEIERSNPPHSDGPQSARGSRQATAEMDREASSAAANRTAADLARPTSSAEYLAGVIERHKKGSLVALSLVILMIAASAYGGYSLLSRRPIHRSSPRALSRLTFDSGLQSGPAWSPDGNFIAYSSNRGGNFDIWVQPLDAGRPIQVTDSPANDWQPDWSPDGKSIVFRSERDEGGLFVMPAFGGRERKISSFGYRPRWSPDNSEILFLSPGMRLYERPRVYVLPLAGGSPREILTSVGGDEKGVRRGEVAWHPDGQRVSYWDDDDVFWTTPVAAGGRPVRSTLAPEVEKQLKEASVDLRHFRWAPSQKILYFEGKSRGLINIWKITVDPETLRWTGGPERLTNTGLGQDTDIAVSADGKKLAFSTIAQSTRIWLLPFDARTGQVKEAEGAPVTLSDMDVGFPDLSPDGRRLLYTAIRHGTDNQEVRVKSLEDGSDHTLIENDKDKDMFYRFCPRWSPDLTSVAYSRFSLVNRVTTKKPGPMALLHTGGEKEENLLTSEGPWQDYIYDWTPDGRWVLGSTNRRTPDRWLIAMFPVAAAPHAETEMREIASDPERNFWAPRISPDGRWIVFISQQPTEAGTSVIYVVPASGGAPVRITEEKAWSDKPRWSPDGKTIYFISNYNSSFLNVWGIRFDPAQGRPAGRSFQVTNFESPSRMLSTKISTLEMSLNGGLLALPIMDVTGSVYVLESVDR